MAVGFVELLSTAGKVIATTWSQGSRLLWSVAGACAAAAIVLRLGVHFEMAKADRLWTDYGLILTVAAAVFAVLGAFKGYAERQNKKIVLMADEQQSFWAHAPQPDGKTYTQFSLRFHVTNMSDGSLHLSNVRFNRPWIDRRRIFTSSVLTEHPEKNLYGRGFSIRPRSRRDCSADIMVFGIVGGAGRRKPMTVSISLQDHAGCWHKVVFRDLRSPQFRQIYQPRSWARIAIVAACTAIVLILTGWGWKHYL